MRRKLLLFLMPLLVMIGLGLATFAWAQNIDVGVNEIGNVIKLSATDPRIIIARIINIVLLFLGVIAVGLIIYAGFIWMTSAGNDEKVEEAKKILKNAVIGLIIILSSWGIATFILNRLISATGSGSIWSTNTNPPALLGTGAIGACTIERVYPENNQSNVARNTSIIISFKESLRLDSVCQDASANSCTCDDTTCKYINPDAIRIFREDLGDSCDADTCPSDSTNVSQAVIQASSDRRTFIISPESLLGVPEGNTDYQVKLTNALLKDNDDSVFKTCNSDFFQWGFEVSNNLDLTPPQVMRGGIFPLPDNEEDIINQSSAAVAAAGSIQVQACPNIYQEASIINVTPIPGGHSASALI
ncbi:pilin, partial [Patescibacteria group bacterium]|nr:pilin [Patescibacteria group bacterium]